MKKILIMLLMLVMLFNTTAFAEIFSGNFSDPLNNDLFEVVAEVDIEAMDDFSLDFSWWQMVYNDDRSMAKVVETNINYDGTYETKDICDFVELSAASEIYYGDMFKEFDEEPKFNDGLIYADQMGEYVLAGLKDINDEVKFWDGQLSYYSYSYNMGLLWESENSGWAGPEIEEVEYKTTFTSVMTDNSKYEFNYNIGNFNDDGYALMIVGEKGYVIKLKKGIIPTVTYNNKKIGFDQIPVIENGRTLVPLRAIFETFGAQVAWDGSTNTVTATKDDVEVKLTIDSMVAYKNGEQLTLDVPAKIVNGRTLVPVRFVSDCFDVNVEWDANLSRVILTK